MKDKQRFDRSFNWSVQSTVSPTPSFLSKIQKSRNQNSKIVDSSSISFFPLRDLKFPQLEFDARYLNSSATEENILTLCVIFVYECEGEVLGKEVFDRIRVHKNRTIREVLSQCIKQRETNFALPEPQISSDSLILSEGDIVGCVSQEEKGVSVIEVSFSINRSEISRPIREDRVPKIDTEEYYTHPNPDVLARMSESELRSVSGFEIFSQKGKVTFFFPVNLLDCDFVKDFGIGDDFIDFSKEIRSNLLDTNGNSVSNTSNSVIKIEFFKFPFQEKFDYQRYFERLGKIDKCLALDKLDIAKGYLSLTANFSGLKSRKERNDTDSSQSVHSVVSY